MRMKKYLSGFAAAMIAMTIAVACIIVSSPVLAADYDVITDVAAPTLTAEKNENNDIVLSWVAQADTDLDGFSGLISFDHDTFYYIYTDDYTEDLSNTGLNISIYNDIIVAYEKSGRVIYKTGETIFSLILHVSDGAALEPGEEYEFAFKLNDDAYTCDLDDYSWADDSFSTAYHVSGWKQIDGTWYYFTSDGTKATGWLQINGTWYYFASDGAMVTGWLKDGDAWYYLKESGAMATGWVKVDGTWYYLKSSGAMATGWLKDGDTWYYLKSSGAMATGWLKIDGTWYYLKESGVMATGWLQIGSDWYYFTSNGAMAADTTLNIGGINYTFNSSGVWVK